MSGLTVQRFIRRARKAHQCSTCRRDIPVGASYHYSAIPPKHDDNGTKRWMVLRECAHCRSHADA